MRRPTHSAATSAVMAALVMTVAGDLSAATPEDVIRQARDLGVEIAHAGPEIDQSGRLRLAAPRLIGPGLALSAEHLVVDPLTRALHLTGVEFLAPDGGNLERTGSWTRAAQVTFSDPRALRLLAAPTCPVDAPVVADGSHVRMEGLQLSPVDASGWLAGSERLSVTSARIDIGTGPQPDSGPACTAIAGIDASGILAMGPDRSSLTLERLSMAASGPQPASGAADPSGARPEGGASLSGHLEATGLTLMHPDGTPAALVSDARIEGSVDRMPDIPSALRPRALLAAALAAEGAGRFHVRGISIDPGGVTPDGSRTGDLQDISWISGEISGSIVKSAASISGALSVDLSQLLALQVEGAFDIAPADQLPALSGILGDLPAADFLGRLSFRSMTLDVRDLGIIEATAPLTGYGRERLTDRLRRALSATPASISEPVMAFVESVFTTGAGIQAAPPQPILLVQAMMMALIQPDRLGDVLGVTRIR